MSCPSIILGIDPGYARAGWSILTKEKNKLSLLACGCIETNSQQEHAARLKNLNLKLNAIIKKHSPSILAIESLFFFKNLKTALKVAESRGVILMTGIEHNLDINEFTPLQIKQAIVGYGRAEKKQIGQMIKIILKLKTIPQPDDAADAVAVAITCAHSLKNNYLK